jgi:hypothetical protein
MQVYRKSSLFTEDFPVSPSAWLESKKDGTTTGIYGRSFRGWSGKLDLVGSSLKTYLGLCGLPLTTFARTWSLKVTASGFGILKLRLSERGTGGQGYSFWRTPSGQERTRQGLKTGQQVHLSDQARGLWRTPDAGCARGAQSPERFAESQEKHRLLTLNDQVAHLFPTPRAADADKGQRTPEGVAKELVRGHGIDLPAHVQIFPTPTVNGNHNKKGASAKSGDGLATAARLYPTPTCNDAKNNNPASQRTENGRHSNQLNVIAGGSLNPDWVEWLQGLPIGWTNIGEKSPTSPASSEG